MYWFQWIIMLPGALIAGILSTFPLHWLLYFAFANNGTILGIVELPPGANISIEYALYPLIIALVFVLAGFEIAPSNNFKVAILLVVLYILFAISMYFLVMKSGAEIYFQMRSLGSVIGLLIGLYIIKEKKEKKERY